MVHFPKKCLRHPLRWWYQWQWLHWGLFHPQLWPIVAQLLTKIIGNFGLQVYLRLEQQRPRPRLLPRNHPYLYLQPIVRSLQLRERWCRLGSSKVSPRSKGKLRQARFHQGWFQQHLFQRQPNHHQRPNRLCWSRHHNPNWRIFHLFHWRRCDNDGRCWKLRFGTLGCRCCCGLWHDALDSNLRQKFRLFCCRIPRYSRCRYEPLCIPNICS